MPDAAPKISPELVRHVGKLARLSLTEEQSLRFAGQLESILEYVAKIDQVDVKGVEPMAHVLPLKNVLREDVAAKAWLAKEIRSSRDGYG